MGKDKKAGSSQSSTTDQPLVVKPGDPGIEQTDAHVEGHGKDG